MFSRLLFTPLLLFALGSAGLLSAQTALPNLPGDVDTETVLRMGDTVQFVGDGTRSATDGLYDVMGPPASDAHKWFITLITTDGCPACARLKADLARDPNLTAFVNVRDDSASWSHFNEYHSHDRAQNWRWQKIQIKAYPTILIQPPINKQYGDPSTVVDQITGYDGNAKKLATRLRDSIGLYAKKYRESQVNHAEEGHRQASVGDEAIAAPTAPWQPRPKDDEPTPLAPSPLAPLLPVFPFDQPPAPPAPKIPQAAQVVLITDGSEREEDIGPLEALVHRIRERDRFRLREMDYQDAKETYPVTEDDLPAVFITRDGQIEAKILSRLLPALETPQPTPAPDVVEVQKIVEVKGPVEWPDVPWDTFLAILTTGFTPALLIPLGIWLFKVVRAMRKHNDQPLLIPDDGVIDRLVDRGAPRLEALFERLAERLHKVPTKDEAK